MLYRVGIIQKLLQHGVLFSGVSLHMEVLNAEALDLYTPLMCQKFAQ